VTGHARLSQQISQRAITTNRASAHKLHGMPVGKHANRHCVRNRAGSTSRCHVGRRWVAAWLLPLHMHRRLRVGWCSRVRACIRGQQLTLLSTRHHARPPLPCPWQPQQLQRPSQCVSSCPSCPSCVCDVAKQGGEMRRLSTPSAKQQPHFQLANCKMLIAKTNLSATHDECGNNRVVWCGWLAWSGAQRVCYFLPILAPLSLSPPPMAAYSSGMVTHNFDGRGNLHHHCRFQLSNFQVPSYVVHPLSAQTWMWLAVSANYSASYKHVRCIMSVEPMHLLPGSRMLY
jgi:hypothetical protein